MSDIDEPSDSIASTLLIKLPFFVLGVATGMLAVWVSLKWVPNVLAGALQALAGG